VARERSTSAARRLAVVALLGLGAWACASTGGRPAPPAPEFGVLVMAHGGAEQWDAAVREAVAPLEEHFPVEIAFGMAAAESLQRAVARLEANGVRRIGVVRLFVSGESWLERTRQILGLSAGAPATAPAGETAADGPHHGHAMGFWRIETSAMFALSREGLAEAPEMGAVLATRARDLSEDPERESVLVLAHGPADDAENERWLAAIAARAEAIERELPFRRVSVMTLREDWQTKRAEAEEEIRGFVERVAEEDGRCLVIPFRVFGFGPYAEVIGERPHVADGRGLLPHPLVGRWIERQAEQLLDGPFETPAKLRLAAGGP
jgi:hypothetical protein